MNYVPGVVVGTQYKGFPSGSVVKYTPANAGDLGLIPGLGGSLKKEMQPI